MTTQLVFTPPSPDSPGYLRRARKALEFRQKLNSGNADPDTIDLLVEFLLPYLVEPVDRNVAREELFDASETQFIQLIDVVIGNTSGENPTSAQPTKDQSSTGQQG